MDDGLVVVELIGVELRWILVEFRRRLVGRWRRVGEVVMLVVRTGAYGAYGA